jgi:hypothetical protein
MQVGTFYLGRKFRTWEQKCNPYNREHDRLCGLMVKVPGYRSRCPGSIPGATRFSEKQWVWNGVHLDSWVQLRSYVEEKVATPV